MDSLQLGELSITSKSTGVAFNYEHDGAHTLTVPNHQIETLQAFLTAHLREERRVGFRVALDPLSKDVRRAFTVTVSHLNRELQAKAVDLSLTGILLEVPDLELDGITELSVKLRLHKNQVSLNAHVVRQDLNLVALHFPSCLRNGELDPPEALLNIYRALELDWLKSRATP